MTTGLLRQRQVWIDRQGVERPLDDIDERYAVNIIRFLANRAPYLRKHAIDAFPLYERGFMGDWAQDAIEREFDELIYMDPLEWLARQPLVKALQEKVRGS